MSNKTKISRTLCLAGIACLAMPYSASAQDVSGPPASTSEPTRQRVMRLMELTGAAAIGERLAVATADRMITAIGQARPDISDPVLDVVRETTLEYMREAIRAPDGLMPEIVDIYLRHFTAEEVEGLIAFYETPLGAKLASELPQITSEGFAAGERWGKRMAPGLRDAIVARLAAEFPPNTAAAN